MGWPGRLFAIAAGMAVAFPAAGQPTEGELRSPLALRLEAILQDRVGTDLYPLILDGRQNPLPNPCPTVVLRLSLGTQPRAVPELRDLVSAVQSAHPVLYCSQVCLAVTLPMTFRGQLPEQCWDLTGQPTPWGSEAWMWRSRRAPVAGRVEILDLRQDVWVHTSWKDLPGIGPFPTSGIIVRVKGEVFLIDTAWNDPQTEEIAAWVREHLGASIGTVIVTHAHDDKMGGLAALHAMGVRSLALAETNRAAVARGLTPAKEILKLHARTATIAGGAIEIFHPGAGHTSDNIVVYVRAARALFGGCLVRPALSNSLGNTADADVASWDDAVARVKERYPAAVVVVPSHGPPGEKALLDHTIDLVRAHAKAR